MYEIVTLGRGWLHYIASAHIMVNVVEEIYQCWNKNWIVFCVKSVLSTKNYDDDDDDDDSVSGLLAGHIRPTNRGH